MFWVFLLQILIQVIEVLVDGPAVIAHRTIHLLWWLIWCEMSL